MSVPKEYLKPGKIAGEVREDIRHREMVGESLAEICDYVEESIRSKGGQPAFPCNVCVNDIAAHYTAMIDDEGVVGDSDVVKVDIGVHLDGYIADTAVTVSYNPEFDSLVRASEAALLEAVRGIRKDVSAGEIGAIIDKVASRWGYKPIVNLSGHMIEQYTIHAGKSIPNIRVAGSPSLRIGEIYAVEPFLTTKDAGGSVVSTNTKNIFSLATRKRTGESRLDEFVQLIWERYRSLPFAARYFADTLENREVEQLIDRLLQQKVLRSYPVLVEERGGIVAQAEHTVTPSETGVAIVTQS